MFRNHVLNWHVTKVDKSRMPENAVLDVTMALQHNLKVAKNDIFESVFMLLNVSYRNLY